MSFTYNIWIRFILFVLLINLPALAYAQINFETLDAFLESEEVIETDEFWADIESTGTPIIGKSLGSHTYEVIFIYRAEKDNIAKIELVSPLSALPITNDAITISRKVLSKKNNTSIWFWKTNVSPKLRSVYRFKVFFEDGSTQVLLDPFNKNIFAPNSNWAKSIVALPDAPKLPWIDHVANGNWEVVKFESNILGKERKIDIYLPEGYSATRNEPYALFLGIDSYGFQTPLIDSSKIIEFLSSENKIPEHIIVLTEDLGPIGDFSGDYASSVNFLAMEIIPLLRTKYNLSRKPEDNTIAGMSRRGMLASYVAFKHPEVFGKVISLSGSYYWRPKDFPEYEWLPKLFSESEQLPIRFYLSAGSLETFISNTNQGHYLLGTNRHMRNILEAKAYPYKYEEFIGGHSEINWSHSLFNGLMWMWE